METKDAMIKGSEGLNAIFAWWGTPSATHPDAICASMARETADDFRKQLSEAEQPADKSGKRPTSSA
ncbi:hypothetical protein GRZ55_03665 [Chelativorans sp. ZYF759]|uniref:hypothetical protein n=1 Tax=Chelativorans sp. ZYF759 TaxID=2692213 RepID=UPI00145C52B9|nr:hypothetical protein [Chelativorans sp. ZYF759]NMG38337.1 hypothetical protein [Chelativorans sp. ZYF759]